MYVDGKISEGYVIICDEEHSFVATRLGISVECSHCGCLALGTDLAEGMFSSSDCNLPIGNGAM